MTMEFYAASYGASGFVNNFGEIFSPLRFKRLYIIKGGPGTGKSTFMKKLGERAEKRRMSVEYYRCSSDPDSLDGIIIKELELAVIDGTAPHTTDPIYPAAIDSILNFGAFIDRDKAERKREIIIGISKKIAGLYSSARRYLEAADRIHSERMSAVEKYINREKMQKHATKYRKDKNAPLFPHCEKGHCTTRYISSSVPKRGRLYKKIIENYKTYLVQSRYGGEHYFLRTVAENAEKDGNTVIRCPSPVYSDTLEAVIICETGNAYIATAKCDGIAATVNADKFFCGISERAGYARLCKKTEEMLWGMSDAVFYEISHLHGELERIYGECTDFRGLTTYTDNLLSEIIGEND